MRKKLKLLILTTPLVIAPIVLNPIVLKQNTNQKDHDLHLINQVNHTEKNDLKSDSNKDYQNFNQTFIATVKKENNNNSSDKKLETKHWVLIGLLITVIIILVITLIMLTIKKIDQVKNQPLKNDDDEK